MNKKDKDLNFETPSVGRVEKLFPQNKQLERSKNPSKTQSFNQVKLPKVPTIAFNARKDKKGKKITSTNASQFKQDELPKDAQHTKKRASHKDFLNFSGNTVDLCLSPERVRNWKLKEYLLAAQRLKKMRKDQEFNSKEPVASHQVTKIDKNENQIKEDREKTAAWQEYIKLQEERHFQTTRITKILND